MQSLNDLYYMLEVKLEILSGNGLTKNAFGIGR